MRRRGFEVGWPSHLGEPSVLQTNRESDAASHLQVPLRHRRRARNIFSFMVMLPSCRQQRSRCSRVGDELRLALLWWLEVLGQFFCEARPWKMIATPHVHMLCDARSTPPRVAAVLLIDRKVFWSDWEPEREVMELFKSRRDGQIMSLELLSIAFGPHVLPFERVLMQCAACGRPRHICCLD